MKTVYEKLADMQIKNSELEKQNEELIEDIKWLAEFINDLIKNKPIEEIIK